MQPGGPLISVDELVDRLDEVPHELSVLDVRYRMAGPAGGPEFAAGHVPGAAYVDLDSALAAPPGPGGRHPLPDVGVFEAAMRAAGVSAHRPVVVYDDWEGRAAARCWWLLRWAGHSDVRVLDGGWTAWTGSGGPVSVEPSRADPGDFIARPGQLPTVEADEVLALAERGVLVDARNPERFRGEVEPVDPFAGHIPGAVNVPTGANLRDDGTFKSPEELRATYRRAGVVEDREVATYCGSGVTAAHDLLAMAVAGLEGALYPGSWSEWVSDPARPVASE